MGKTLVVGIAGGSGCGKTTLIKSLLRQFDNKITVIHHDNYYRAHDDMTYEERCRINYDCPEAFETDRLVEDLWLLREGKAIDCPVYDFTVHNRSKMIQRIEPHSVIVVEGILIFADQRLNELMNIKVFVDADADVRLARRVVRDVEERGRSVKSVVNQWQETVKPMHELYVEPSKRNADIIIPRGGKNSVALDLLTCRIEKFLQ